MNAYSIQELEANIKYSKEAIELGNALERLFSNRDFKQVIVNGYFEKEAVRLVHAKADDLNKSADAQTSIVLQIDSIGVFNRYLKDITEKASFAKKALEADELTRSELIEEGLNNG